MQSTLWESQTLYSHLKPLQTPEFLQTTIEIKDQTENTEWVINFGLVALLPGLSAYSITITNIASSCFAESYLNARHWSTRPQILFNGRQVIPQGDEGVYFNSYWLSLQHCPTPQAVTWMKYSCSKLGEKAIHTKF